MNKPGTSSPSPPGPATQPVRDLSPRWTRRRTWHLAIALATVVVLGGGYWGLYRWWYVGELRGPSRWLIKPGAWADTLFAPAVRIDYWLRLRRTRRYLEGTWILRDPSGRRGPKFWMSVEWIDNDPETSPLTRGSMGGQLARCELHLPAYPEAGSLFELQTPLRANALLRCRDPAISPQTWIVRDEFSTIAPSHLGRLRLAAEDDTPWTNHRVHGIEALDLTPLPAGLASPAYTSTHPATKAAKADCLLVRRVTLVSWTARSSTSPYAPHHWDWEEEHSRQFVLERLPPGQPLPETAVGQTENTVAKESPETP